MIERHEPFINTCFFCGKPKPGNMFTHGLMSIEDYEPCPSCREIMDSGYTVVSVARKPYKEGQFEIQEGLYPTGKWFVAPEGFRELAEIFMDEEELDKLKSDRRCLLEAPLYDMLTETIKEEYPDDSDS